MSTILLKFQQNWKSGLTVSLVSIPLSVSLAVASHTTPVIGIVTAIWAGIIASLFGGSNFNIVGPTGALSGLLAAYAIEHGAETLSVLAIVSGLFILVAFFFKLERYLVFVPANTIHGFTLGVACIIALNELDYAFGLTGLAKTPEFIHNVQTSFSHIFTDGSLTAFSIFVIFLVALFVLLKVTPKFPGPITLAPLGILLGYLSEKGIIPLSLETLGSQYKDMAGTLFVPHSFVFDYSLLFGGATIAFIAILETMISARIADSVTGTKYDKRKEMLGLGLANIVSGLMGGIAATAALARTSLNIKTGANDKISATVSSISIAIVSLLLLSYFKYIPLPVIAAILVYVAIRMIEAEHFIRMFKVDKKSFFISIFVAGLTLYKDPITGILAGTVIALLLFMELLSRGQFELIVNDENKKIIGRMTDENIEEVNKQGETLVYSIKGQLAYINAQAHISRFEDEQSSYKNVILRLRELYFVDLDGVDAFDEIITLIETRNKKVLITGVNPLIRLSLKESAEFKKLEKRGLVFQRTQEALAYLGF